MESRFPAFAETQTTIKASSVSLKAWPLLSHRVQWLRELVMTSPGILEILVTSLTLPQPKSVEKRNRLLHNSDADAHFRHRIAPLYGAHGKGDVFSFVKSVVYRPCGKLRVANGQKIDVVVLWWFL